jgi:hypothetical protein
MNPNDVILNNPVHLGRNDDLDDDNASHDEDDEDDKDDADEKEIDPEFTENVIKYIRFDDIIRDKKKEIKDITKLKQNCEKYILTKLEEYGENKIEFNQGKIIKKDVVSKGSIKPDYIKTALTATSIHSDVVDKIIEMIEKNRKIKINKKLTRSFLKK